MSKEIELPEKFLNELKELCKKYGAKHLSVCCNMEDKFLGVIGADVNNDGEYFQAVLNIARLYQSSREKIKSLLDKFEN